MMWDLKHRLNEGAVTFVTGAFPSLVTLSRHKEWVFAISALLLAAGGWALYRGGRSCPTDPALARLFSRFDGWNRRLYWTSVAIWGIGFFAAFLLLPLTLLLEGAASETKLEYKL